MKKEPYELLLLPYMNLEEALELEIQYFILLK